MNIRCKWKTKDDQTMQLVSCHASIINISYAIENPNTITYNTQNGNVYMDEKVIGIWYKARPQRFIDHGFSVNSVEIDERNRKITFQ